MNAKNISPEKIVRSQHIAAQAVPLLAAVASGLAATLAWLWLAHPAFSPVANWEHLRFGWLAGLAVTLLGTLLLWRARRRPLLHSAVEMDMRLATCNRLEAATALQSAADPMARAQRTETEQFLQHSQIAPRRRGLAVLTALVAVLALAHLATLICWARSVQLEMTAKKDSQVSASAKKPATLAVPVASIEWHSPESETAATAIEEVPLEAEADSATGLRDAVLEIEVNGAHRLSQPLSDDLSKAGTHTLKPSIYLDQLDVKTYDIVSYHLSAHRIFTGPLPATTSPVQFVQIKPVREDTFICAGGDQPSRCFNYVTALKAAQLRLMKDNFTLAHAEVGHDNDEWREENSRVGGGQNQLAGRTDEVIELMTTNHYPEPILGLVRQSQPLMTDAGGKILETENQPALAPQGQALGYLTEVEKYLKNSIKLAGVSMQPKANDPFQRPKNLDLKTHPLTRAGKIDALAKEQSRLAGDLASGNTNSTVKLAAEEAPPGAEPITGTPGERQTEIKQRIGDFLNDPGVVPDALKHLQAGDALAGQSQEQIDKNDFAAASEPAAAAARELRSTAAALRAGGNQSAKNKLADALLQLSAAAGNVRKAASAGSDAAAAAELKKAEEGVREAARQLAAEAQRQQDNGATNAAARLGEMAKLLQSQSLQQMLAQAQQSPRDSVQTEGLAKKLDDLSAHAGQLGHSAPLTRQELARLVERLQRAQANLNNLASQCTSPGAAQSGKAGQSQSVLPGGSGLGQGQTSDQKRGSENSPASAQGSTPEPLAHARGAELSRADMQRAEAAQLLDELRLSGGDARGAMSKTADLTKLDDILRGAAERPDTDLQDIAPLAAEINPPLTGLINALKTELAGMRRPFELASEETADAPPAYRPAVADYFEQVSRDYQPAKDDALKTQ